MNIRRIRSINRFVYIGIVIIALCIIYLFPPDYSESSVYFPDSKFWLNLSIICNGKQNKIFDCNNVIFKN